MTLYFTIEKIQTVFLEKGFWFIGDGYEITASVKGGSPLVPRITVYMTPKEMVSEKKLKKEFLKKYHKRHKEAMRDYSIRNLVGKVIDP